MLLARNLDNTETPRESFSGCLQELSGTADDSIHPIKSIPPFRGLQFPVRSCICQQVECKRSVVGSFMFSISTTAAPLS